MGRRYFLPLILCSITSSGEQYNGEHSDYMIDDIRTNKVENKILTSYFESLVLFLKYGYNNHVMKVNDDCTTHGIKFVLCNHVRISFSCPTTPSSRNIKIDITCT